MTIIGLIGGTGPEGLGLAMRFVQAGHTVQIGSRRRERAQEAATTVREAVRAAGGTGPNSDTATTGDTISGDLNAGVAAASEIVVIVLPFDGHAETLAGLRDAIGGKLVVDAVVPLVFRKGVPGVVAVPEGSATEQAQALLPDAAVVGAFHNFSALKLQALDAPVEGDVLITADDAAAKARVMDLVAALPNLRGVDAGPLAMSKFVEDITALLLGINRRSKAQAAVRIVGI